MSLESENIQSVYSELAHNIESEHPGEDRIKELYRRIAGLRVIEFEEADSDRARSIIGLDIVQMYNLSGDQDLVLEIGTSLLDSINMSSYVRDEIFSEMAEAQESLGEILIN